jgi:hypothetical protein
LITSQHAPDRLGQLAGQVDLRDLGTVLAAETPSGALVALAVQGVRGAAIAASINPQRRYLGPCLDSGPRWSICPDCLTRGHRPVYPVSLTGEERPLISPLTRHCERGDPAETRAVSGRSPAPAAARPWATRLPAPDPGTTVRTPGVARARSLCAVRQHRLGACVTTQHDEHVLPVGPARAQKRTRGG